MRLCLAAVAKCMLGLMMESCMRSVFQLNIRLVRVRLLTRAVQWSRHFAVALLLCGASAFAQLPDAPGKTETIRVCKECHEIERAVSKRQDRPGWEATMDKMFALGAKIS